MLRCLVAGFALANCVPAICLEGKSQSIYGATELRSDGSIAVTVSSSSLIAIWRGEPAADQNVFEAKDLVSKQTRSNVYRDR
jgi:hypothetical protein